MAFGVYIHVPFCIAKCPYCHFTSHVAEPGELNSFPTLLTKEITGFFSKLKAKPANIASVYFGGGTPSLLLPEAYDLILSSLRRAIPFTENPELTVEVNPGAISKEFLEGYKQAGVNRISLGVQSFSDRILQFLGRSHNTRQAIQVLDMARPIFDNMSVDFMYAIPGLSDDVWRVNLEELSKWSPEHLSAYSLTREAGTPMAHRLPIQGDEVQYLRQQLVLLHVTKQLGLERYELTNFAKPGFRSRHNSSYWEGEPYVGFGPAAHSFMGDRRWWNVHRYDVWRHRIEAGKSPKADSERITRSTLYRERIMLGLRTVQGVNMERLLDTDPLQPHLIERPITAQLVRSGLAEIEGQFLRLSPEGMAVSDEIIRRLI